MKNEYLYGIIGLLAGLVIAVFFANNAVNTGNTRMMGMMGMRQQSLSCPMASVEKDKSMSMMEMMEGLEGKAGDDFDKTFIEEMIEHHQGAIDMAKEAQVYGKHDEIKNLADEIISAQTREIEMMRRWQKDWDY
ncbi:MAG: hypothetical protein A2186_03170 [Candidatus Levybacteria bacterium RIFOXYA1_FULL_41_10]|nr:MAG: hypothetical protein UT44_C0015G0024 [Candidatus Levybacteria bacterium GW2011_GWA1_39_32]KKR49838.1 MAG: hypothetical protein UT87_C0024G0006 [Candidatus Levybacteria bacterium GW2011_GWC1_40_19]KKR71926.1 MAG: hypothetical protein UU15_C0039G0004 [Candidatus Levybacteria bacterium GW2011_GWC2_40_7]KKR94758.1 MAG: hypothetical protein UU45_C0007G0006 [Candidatus Levybacteria bacterium GW2011_GWA2_41_15]KKS01033.1 MAG: hypothetical protein UU52_C0020G0006 [Candidatus Levybacteria bacter